MSGGRQKRTPVLGCEPGHFGERAIDKPRLGMRHIIGGLINTIHLLRTKLKKLFERHFDELFDLQTLGTMRDSRGGRSDLGATNTPLILATPCCCIACESANKHPQLATSDLLERLDLRQAHLEATLIFSTQ